MTQPYDVEFATQQYQEWLTALKEKSMLATHNQAQAMMQAVMTELRNSISDEVVLDIANALPALPRGIFLEGWRLGEAKAVPAKSEEFFRRLCTLLAGHHTPPSDIVDSVFAVWKEKLPLEAQITIEKSLPEALKSSWIG